MTENNKYEFNHVKQLEKQKNLGRQNGNTSSKTKLKKGPPVSAQYT